MNPAEYPLFLIIENFLRSKAPPSVKVPCVPHVSPMCTR